MYKDYAAVYARIGQAAWSVRMAAWTLDWLALHGIEVQRVADFGCGTGAAAQVFASAGKHVIGVDCAPAMLDQARAHGQGTIEWLAGDIRTVELAATVDLVVAYYDTLNYLLTIDDLLAVWQTAARALRPGGYAVVDVNTSAAYATDWNDRDTITADRDDLFVLNRLSYRAVTRIGTGRIVWFVREGDDWIRHEEEHHQRAHSDAEIVEAATRAGLRLIERTTPSGAAVDEQTLRLIYIFQKHE